MVWLVMRTKENRRRRSSPEAIFSTQDAAEAYAKQYGKHVRQTYWVAGLELDADYPVQPDGQSLFHLWTNGTSYQAVETGWHRHDEAREYPRRHHHPWEKPGDVCLTCQVIAHDQDEALAIGRDRFQLWHLDQSREDGQP